jgi:thiosulfate/3-mercaptopyruvate sulfurtransferase
VHLELEELGSRSGAVENVLLPPAEFGRLMGERGISNGNAVVAYDNSWGLAAARLVWALHRYGHDLIAVLDGGWDRWQDEGGPVAEGEERVTSGRFEATLRPDAYASTEWIVGRIERGHGARDVVLVDTRTPAEFDKGHLPGAVGWDWLNAVPAGSWNSSRDPEELRAEWQTLGFDPSDEVVVYCRSGMRAAHTYLVLRNAGFSRVRLYDGSWQEWSMTMGGAGGH